MAVGRTRTWIASAATAALVGIAFSVTGGQGFGSWLPVAALVGLLFGLHRFGRSGPDSGHSV
jgi:hypothetical protein